MNPQVNVDYGVDRAQRLQDSADAMGISRPAYMRMVADALFAAQDAGRDPFAGEPAALTARDIAEHRAAVMEMARIAAEWAKHGAALRKAERDDQLLLSKARAELMEGIPKRLNIAVEPFREEMKVLAARIDEQPRLDMIAEELAALRLAQEAHVGVLSEHTNALKKAIAEPRTQYALVLGDDRVWSTAFVAGWSLIMAFLGGLVSLHLFG